jgi:hypothetical protein
MLQIFYSFFVLFYKLSTQRLAESSLDNMSELLETC